MPLAIQLALRLLGFLTENFAAGCLEDIGLHVFDIEGIRERVWYGGYEEVGLSADIIEEGYEVLAGFLFCAICGSTTFTEVSKDEFFLLVPLDFFHLLVLSHEYFCCSLNVLLIFTSKGLQFCNGLQSFDGSHVNQVDHSNGALEGQI